MNWDGSDVREVPTHNHPISPSWSADGRQLVYRSDNEDREGYSSEIYVINLDGSGETRIFTNPMKTNGDEDMVYEVAWCPVQSSHPAAAHSWRTSAVVAGAIVVLLVAVYAFEHFRNNATVGPNTAVELLAPAPSTPAAVSPMTAPPEPSTLLGKWYWKGTEDYYDFRANGRCLANSDTSDQRGWDPQVMSCDVNTPGYIKLSFESEPTTFAIVSFSSSEMHIAKTYLMGPNHILARDERVLIRK
jgi:dipeptidyl aminopeptidase/acylaminoacyl peptidase